jgi:hypothetical protein
MTGKLTLYLQSVYYNAILPIQIFANRCRYRKYAGSKWRTLDVAFISRFEPEEVLAIVEATKGIPIPATKRPSLLTVPFPTPPASDGYEWEED